MSYKSAIASSSLCLVTAAVMTVTVPGQAATLPQVSVPPPPLGWSSWNSFGNDVSQPVIEQQADALALLDKSIASRSDRYRYVNIDGGWWLSSYGYRTATGGFAINPALWDNGSLADVVQYIHGDGLLAGAYTDAGRSGCGGQNGSEDYYIPDMTQFASWGFDYVKVDYCGGAGEGLDPQEQYTELAQAIGQAAYSTKHMMLLSICDWGWISGPAGFADSGEGPWSWAAGVGDLPRVIWRTSGDITASVGGSAYATFQQALNNFHSAIHPEAEHTGYYDDPDMMIAGINGVDANPANPVQSQAHISLWAVAGAPLIIGANVAALEAENSPILGLLTNTDVIDVDQDARGLQALEVATPTPGVEVWSKLLSGSGRRAVVMLNTTLAAATATVTAAELGLAGGAVSFHDDWSHAAVPAKADGSLSVSVAPNSARMFTVSGTDLASTGFNPLSSKGPGRVLFDVNGAAVVGGAKTFALHNGFNALDIAYSNPGHTTRYAALTVAGQPSTNVAFPPTGGAVGTVSVEARLMQTGDNDISFSTQTGPAPKIVSLSLAAGPVPVFAQVYPAAAASSVLSGAAVLQSCVNCDNGFDVGYIGSGGGQSGTLTVNGITVPKAGTYTLLIGYLNGDSVTRYADVSVNGGTAANVPFPIAGSDFNTVGVVPLTVSLNAGANSVTFSNPTGWAPNLAALDVAPGASK